MASQTSSGELISQRYASALYDLAANSQSIDDIESDLNFLKECISINKELKLLVKSPLIASKDKLSILENIISKKSINKLTSNFLKIISMNKRFANLAGIIESFNKINLLKRGEVVANVTSAEELSKDQIDGITNQLKSILGNKISLNFNVDKKIIAGLIVKVGSKMIDSSLASKINKLKVAMKGA